jgi:serine/threonine protein kinase
MRMSMTGEEYELEKKKLHREVNILRNLSHPNVVRLIDVSESNDSVYVVQELIEGGELFSRITDDPDFRNENVIKYVFCQLADAVLYLHSKAVIHRDIKPENILVQSCDPRPPPGVNPIPDCPVYPLIKVVDFGLSKEISSMSSLAQTWVGTPQYWAPEVIQSREKGTPYDGRSDIWSVGVLLYVSLFRRYPFTEPKLPGELPMQERILRGQFSFPSASRVSMEARDLIKKLIVPDLDDRWSLEQSFHHEWFYGFEPAKILSQRWPVGHTASIESNMSVIMEDETGGSVAHPVLVSEPSSSSHGGSPQSGPVIQGVRDDLVPFLMPNPVEDQNATAHELVRVSAPPQSPSSPIIPNIALAQQCAIDQFQLMELARIQNEILVCFTSIQKNFNMHPHAFHLMATLTARARELQFVSATTVSKFAITAESAEGVIEDSSLFVKTGAVDASLSCVEEIRASVSEMLDQCRNVQEQYRSLLDDVNNLIAGSRIVLNNDPTVKQAIEDIIRTEAESSSTASPMRTSNARLSTSSVESVPARNSHLNRVVASAMSVALPVVADGAVVPAENISTERLLSSSLRDLRRVDDILGKCRLFWSNVEQCLLRLDLFKSTSYRLIENVHLSPILMDRYDARVAEHKAFWTQFKRTCTEYAQVSQIEYQKFRQHA